MLKRHTIASNGAKAADIQEETMKMPLENLTAAELVFGPESIFCLIRAILHLSDDPSRPQRMNLDEIYEFQRRDLSKVVDNLAEQLKTGSWADQRYSEMRHFLEGALKIFLSSGNSRKQVLANPENSQAKSVLGTIGRLRVDKVREFLNYLPARS